MGWWLTQAVGLEAYDAANNRTLYRTRVYVNWNGGSAYAGYTTSGGGSVAGQGFSFGGPSSMNYNGSSWISLTGSQEVYTGTFWVGSDANGYLSGVYADSWFNGGGGYAPGYITASASAGGVDYDRRPAQPSISTVTVNSNKTISLSWSAVSSPASTATYYVSYAAAAGGGGYGSWSSEITTTSTNYTYSGLPRGVTYKFRIRAGNSDGLTGYSETTGYFLPAGGKIYDAGSFRLTAFGRKFDGTNWIDLTTAKKFDGSTWVDLS